MAPLHRILSLGIIILLVSYLGNSATIKEKQTPDKVEEENLGENDGKTAQGGEQEQLESNRVHKPVQADNQGEEETTEKNADDQSKSRVSTLSAESPTAKSQGAKKDDSAKLRFSGHQRLDDDQSDCADDITRLCSETPKGNNFALLNCLQEKAKEDDLTTECHHMLWEYKRTFSKDIKFEKAVQERLCVDDLKLLPDCQRPGQIIPCLLENRQNLTVPSCKHMMTKMQTIFFSNFRLISNFLDDCSEDVNKYQCGRIQTELEDEDIHSQNDVLECLEEHQEELSQKCQKQIYRLAELSSDDYHLDRPLYYACLDDRERFCADIPSGEGRVYKCLKKHKSEETMSDECRARLTERQKMEAKHAKANYPLMKNCVKFYHQYKDKYECEKGNTKHGVWQIF
ncbi:hypothetical protein OS493_032848 [Desmophyllum pertusum]|uniref:Golgi apparatus protein 1 n=1 Tax=Desmophyllum pertusum TaxID=174260 RepID=A0A9X0CR26_9CNID|nr:hypothetical protein OS493_032848 [Desmophyllum pertusum]